MADTMQFDLVSPERNLVSVQVTEVQIPGADGDMTAMPDHAPVITTLRPGVLKASGPEGAVEYIVTGGFAEITTGGASVLAERAYPVSEMTQELLDEFVADAVIARDNATPETLDPLVKRVADLTVMAEAIGLTATQS